LRFIGCCAASPTAREEFLDLPLQSGPVIRPHFDEFTRITIFTADVVEDVSRRETAWRRRLAAATDGLRLFTPVGRPSKDGKHLRENPKPDEQRREETLEPIESGGEHGSGHVGSSRACGPRCPGFV
jgi:hypothetical protein